jgi:hypothetical protein
MGQASFLSHNGALCEVAWGNFLRRAFLLAGLARLFDFLLLPLKINSDKRKKAMCRLRVGQKA